MKLGIDFGTTRTVVAWSDRGNYPVVSFSDEVGDLVEWFPSVVAEKNGELKFAFDALGVSTVPGWHTVRSFKRLLSGPEASTQGVVQIGSSKVSILELLVRFFDSLHLALRTRSNLPRKQRDVSRFDAIVATPANAFCTQRFVTLDAFGRAGFDVTMMLNEPSAAGFEYSHRHGRTLNSKREHVVVYDLGGGTFDASLVRMSGKHHEAVTTAGLARLGGDDFDRALVDLVCQRAQLTHRELSESEQTKLADVCREAKEKINPNSKKISIDLEFCLADRAPVSELSIAVNDYYEVCNSLVEQTLTAMTPVIQKLDGDVPRAEEDILADIAGIYVVGGASALPVISRVLRGRFGRRVHRSPYPHAAVAIGLAIAADEGAGFELSDRFSRNFGVFREAQSGAKATYDAIFTRDVALPKPGEPELVTKRRYRAMHNIGHFRFFECSAFDDDGNPQGDLAPMTEILFAFDPMLRDDGVDLRTSPIKRLTKPGSIFEECYSINAHGMVTFTITDLDTGYECVHQLGSGSTARKNTKKRPSALPSLDRPCVVCSVRGVCHGGDAG